MTTFTDAPVWHQDIEDVPWVTYEDPHLPAGDQAAQVKILHPNVFLAWFPAGFEAPSHAHPFDTVYFVQEGRIRFGDEGWFGPGSVRGVQAGHEYGPEQADPDTGVQFLLVSSGPIAINWVD